MTWQLYWPGWWKRLWPYYMSWPEADMDWNGMYEYNHNVLIIGPLQIRWYS